MNPAITLALVAANPGLLPLVMLHSYRPIADEYVISPEEQREDTIVLTRLVIGLIVVSIGIFNLHRLT